MARIFTTGFETGSADMFPLGTGIPTLVGPPTPRTGSYMLGTDSNGRGTALSGNPTEFYYRDYMYFDSLNGGGNERYILVFKDHNGVTQCGVTLNTTASPAKISAYGDNSTTTVLAASSGSVLTQGVWLRIEVHVVFHASAGTFQIRVEGSTVVNYSGATSWAGIAEGGQLWILGSPNDAVYHDDLAVNDTTGTWQNSWPGDGRVVAYLPVSGGDVTSLSLGGSSPAATNFQSVDEVPPNDGTDFVYGTTGYDLYALQNSSANMINAIQVWGRSQKSDAGAASGDLVIKTGGNEYRSTSTALSTTYGYLGQAYGTNPQTSGVWTPSDLNALQVGPEAL